ncbi:MULTISPECIES: cytochrome c biogenesis protein CcdA [Salinibaculum]|uniref:cytochrome c biogenesis protein CcdA n=1 Tax=Salinibaculum TaxID=2732368 RepID=UPI0030CB01BD
MSEAVASHLAFAAGAGAATFLSPCALPLVPGYVGYYVSAADDGRGAGGIATRGVAAAAGVLVTLAALAGLAVLVGRPVTQSLPVVEPLVGVALVVLGALVVTGRAPDWRVALPERRADAAGFALFGAGYAGASAGCVLPVFLAVVLNAVTLPPTLGLAVVGVYAASVALPLLLVTVAVGTGLDVATGRLAAYGRSLERVAGVVLVLAGLGQVAVALAPELLPSLALP